MVQNEKKATVPEHLRCSRSDGRKWRCQRRVMASKKMCQIHCLQQRHRNFKKKVPESLKLHRKNKRKKDDVVAVSVCKMARKMKIKHVAVCRMVNKMNKKLSSDENNVNDMPLFIQAQIEEALHLHQLIHFSCTPKSDEESEEEIIDVREELMISQPYSAQNQTTRIAYFLKPCAIQESLCDFSLPFTSNHAEVTQEVRYNGWQKPLEEWKTWVQKMQLKYEQLWVKAGIDNAIQASTYEFNRNDELILALAQRWCSKTNTFIFPWGEATITLEDLKVCWGYSVTGAAVSSPLETSEHKEIEAKLIEVRRMFNSSTAKKVLHKPWMMHFMKNESIVEHEAFLICWLSRFVFPANSFETILKSVFSIAIHLAQGTRVALAPAVLASIYRDLSLLSNSVRSASTMNLSVTLWAPFQLVQVWALERFPALQPNPRASSTEQGQPIMAKWHNVKMLKNNNLNLILDAAGNTNGFLWRLYQNSPPLYLYNEKDMWMCDNPCFDYELQSFGRCLRVSELVGMGCVEQYHPHRVGMQFKMDQDIPGVVAPCNKDPWMSYSQPIMDINLCTALCSSQPKVTSRYYNWWKQLNSGKEGDTMKGYDHCLISKNSSQHLSPALTREVKCDLSFGPLPDFTCKFGTCQVGNSGDNADESKITDRFCDRNCVDDMEGEGVSPCTIDEAFNLKSKICKLERLIAKLKAAKFGSKVETIVAKANP